MPTSYHVPLMVASRTSYVSVAPSCGRKGSGKAEYCVKDAKAHPKTLSHIRRHERRRVVKSNRHGSIRTTGTGRGSYKARVKIKSPKIKARNQFQQVFYLGVLCTAPRPAIRCWRISMESSPAGRTPYPDRLLRKSPAKMWKTHKTFHLLTFAEVTIRQSRPRRP